MGFNRQKALALLETPEVPEPDTTGLTGVDISVAQPTRPKPDIPPAETIKEFRTWKDHLVEALSSFEPIGGQPIPSVRGTEEDKQLARAGAGVGGAFGTGFTGVDIRSQEQREAVPPIIEDLAQMAGFITGVGKFGGSALGGAVAGAGAGIAGRLMPKSAIIAAKVAKGKAKLEDIPRGYQMLRHALAEGGVIGTYDVFRTTAGQLFRGEFDIGEIGKAGGHGALVGGVFGSLRGSMPQTMANVKLFDLMKKSVRKEIDAPKAFVDAAKRLGVLSGAGVGIAAISGGDTKDMVLWGLLPVIMEFNPSYQGRVAELLKDLNQPKTREMLIARTAKGLKAIEAQKTKGQKLPPEELPPDIEGQKIRGGFQEAPEQPIKAIQAAEVKAPGAEPPVAKKPAEGKVETKGAEAVRGKLDYTKAEHDKDQPYSSKNAHKKIILEAIDRGDEISERTLKDYPDLIKKVKERDRVYDIAKEEYGETFAETKLISENVRKMEAERDALSSKKQKSIDSYMKKYRDEGGAAPGSRWDEAYKQTEVVKLEKQIDEINENIALARGQKIRDFKIEADTPKERKGKFLGILELLLRNPHLEEGTHGKVTVKIPGDGEFEFINNKKSIAEIIKRVSKTKNDDWTIRNIPKEVKPEVAKAEDVPEKDAIVSKEDTEIGKTTEPIKTKTVEQLGKELEDIVTGKNAPIVPKGIEVANNIRAVEATTKQILDFAKKPVRAIAGGVAGAKSAMIEHDRNIRRAESTAELTKKTVADVVPDPERQMLMVHAYEHKMKGKYWDQLNSTEKDMVKWAAGEKAKINQYIKENKVLTPRSEANINHIFHHWINPETGKPYKGFYGKFSKGLPQAKQRTIPTYEAGIAKGLKPATTNIGEIIGLEWQAVTNANNARQLFETLRGIPGDPQTTIKLSGKNPQPIRMVEKWSDIEKQGLTEGYEEYHVRVLDETITYGVRKELSPFVRAYIESPTYGKLSQLNFAAKSMKLSMSLFHVMSLGMQELANIRVPFVHIPKGLKLIKDLPPSVRLLHQEGLELRKGYEDVGEKAFGGLEVGKVGRAVTKPLSIMRDFIFDIVQPGMKTSFADTQLRKLLPRYLKGTGWTAEEVFAAYSRGEPVPPEALRAARDVVKKADGHFSGEHYKRALLETGQMMAKLYFDPRARKFWQAVLLSPTWQREHLLVAKNVAKSFMPDKMIKKLGMEEMGAIKSQYRKYALGAIMIIGAVDLWNYMATDVMDGKGKHIIQNPPGKKFSVRAWWNDPDYWVTDKNGKRKRIRGGAGYIRPLKSVYEMAEWGKDPIKKLGYKASPGLTALGIQLWGSQYKYPRGLPDVPKRILDFALDVSVPITVSQMLQYAKGRKTLPGAVLPAIGFPTSKERKTD